MEATGVTDSFLCQGKAVITAECVSIDGKKDLPRVVVCWRLFVGVAVENGEKGAKDVNNLSKEKDE